MFQEGVKDPELKEEEELEESLSPTSSIRFHWLRPASHRITSAIARAQENGFLTASTANCEHYAYAREPVGRRERRKLVDSGCVYYLVSFAGKYKSIRFAEPF